MGRINGNTLKNGEYTINTCVSGNLVKSAQGIINSKDSQATKEQWQELCGELFKQHMEIGNISKPSNEVINWDSQNNRAGIILLRSIGVENQLLGLNEWQLELYSRVKNLRTTKKVYICDNKFWVIVKKPSTSMILKYSDLYISLFDRFPDLDCDFLVLGETEFGCTKISNTAIILEGWNAR